MVEWIISSSVLIVVIILLRFVLKGKISLRLQYALWSLVLVRLLLPVSIGNSSISIMSQVEQTNIYQETAQTVTEIRVPSDIIRDSELTYEEAKQAGNGTLHRVRGYPADGEKGNLHTYSYWDSLQVVGTRILRIVWACGVAVVGLWFVISNLRLLHSLKKSRTPLVSNYELPVYLSDAIDTPCLFGLFRPAIYLTSEAVESETTMRHAVEHELTHYRHKDNVWAILRSVCLAVHWFNPLVWCAAVLSRNDAELACDESTILRLGEDERAAYGRTLIRMTCEKRPVLLSTATTMTGSGRSIKERIALIVKKPKMAIYTLIAVIVIAALAVGCTFTGATEEPVSSYGADSDRRTDLVESDSIEESSQDVSVQETDLPLYTEDWIDRITVPEDGSLGNFPVQRYDGDGWYIYIPVSGWHQQKTIFTGKQCMWTSEYGTGSTLTVDRFESPLEVLWADAEKQGYIPLDSEKLVWERSGDGVSGRYYFSEAMDGGCWRVSILWTDANVTDYPHIAMEPNVLRLMAESFAVSADEQKGKASATDSYDDTFSFLLAPGEIGFYSEQIVFAEDQSEFNYKITWTGLGTDIAIGLLAQDGTEYLQSATVDGGGASGVIDNIPAGAYQVFVRNIEAIKYPDTEIENLTATGVVAFSSLGIGRENTISSASTIEVSDNILFNEETFQITGEAARELLSLLNCLSYDRGTCDGIPEYIITCPDQSKFYLNLSSAWAWNDNDKEAELSDDIIAAISALLDTSVKRNTSSDVVSSTKKENESTSEPETLSSVLQWDGTSYLITNGSTGERVSLATSSDANKMKSLLDGVSILRQDDGDVSAGYLYAIRAVGENGNLSDAICVLNGHVKTDGRIGYYVENDELLINYLETQFE